MPYNPNIHHRRSIRLKGYDYSQAGLYYITICAQDRTCLFGEIRKPTMILNDAGKMVEKWYLELENKYPDIKCHEYVVMPNHFHCIIENNSRNGMETDDHVTETGAHVTETGDHITEMGDHITEMGAHVGAPLRGRPISDQRPLSDQRPIYGPDNKKHNATIGDVVDWFKTMSTNEYIRGVKTFGWQRFNGKLWQRNYWEHIIRDEQSYQTISTYITDNPAKWKDDKFYNQ